MPWLNWGAKPPQQYPEKQVSGSDKTILRQLGGKQDNRDEDIDIMNNDNVPLSDIISLFFVGRLGRIFGEGDALGSQVNLFMRGELREGEAGETAMGIVNGIFSMPAMMSWEEIPTASQTLIENTSAPQLWLQLEPLLKQAEGGKALKYVLGLLHSIASGTNENERQERNRAIAAAAAQQNKQPALGG